MRWTLTLAICVGLSTLAQAFELDGFVDGTPKAQVLKKLQAMGFQPNSDNFGDVDSYRAGPYHPTFCRDTLVFLAKNIEFREWNSFFEEFVNKYPNPTVGILGMGLDIVNVDWVTTDGDFRLTVGVGNDGVRFHTIAAHSKQLSDKLCRAP